MLDRTLPDGTNGGRPWTCVTVQAATPPVGSEEGTTLPPAPARSPTATHRLLLGQETAVRMSTLRCVTFHAVAPPVGLVDVTTLPPLSTATQRPLLGQDTAVRRGPFESGPTEPSTLVTFQAAAP